MIQYNPDDCICCGACTSVCPNGCFQYLGEQDVGYAAPAYDQTFCVECGLCVDECLGGAIEEI